MHTKIAKIQSVPLFNDFPLALKDLRDYGDHSPFGLRCERCFGHLYFDEVNADTGIQFQSPRADQDAINLKMFTWLFECLLGERDAPSTAYVSDVIAKSKYKLTLRLALLIRPYKSRV
jgi:hypothetical protein